MESICVLVVGEVGKGGSALLDLLFNDCSRHARCVRVAASELRRYRVPVGMSAPDLVMIDLLQMGEEGFELAEHVFQRDPRVQVVLLGTDGSYENVRRAMNVGACAYIPRDEADHELLKREHARILKRMQLAQDYVRIGAETVEDAGVRKISDATRRAVKYVLENYRSNLAFSDVVGQVGISESHLRRLFKAEIGVSFVDYLTECRIEAAKKLMRAGEWRTGVIAENTGFSSVRYFCSVFKKHTGMTTREFIRREKGGENETDHQGG